jgi:hypothetical protein
MTINCLSLFIIFCHPSQKSTPTNYLKYRFGLKQDQSNATFNRFLIKEHVMSNQTEVAEAPTHKDPQPSPVTPPSPPHGNSPSNDSAPPPDYKRIAKIAISVFVFCTIQGFVAGLHAAFTALNGQDFLNLSPFWQTVVRFTSNGAADGFFQAFRLGLVAWAGPDVINVVGPYIGFAWRKAAIAVRVMSRAVQGKTDDDAPVDTNKK